jgi:hypothetical protein
VDHVIWSCTTGGLLHVTGLLIQSHNPAAPARLTVDALEVLATAPTRAIGN